MSLPEKINCHASGCSLTLVKAGYHVLVHFIYLSYEKPIQKNVFLTLMILIHISSKCRFLFSFDSFVEMQYQILSDLCNVTYFVWENALESPTSCAHVFLSVKKPRFSVFKNRKFQTLRKIFIFKVTSVHLMRISYLPVLYVCAFFRFFFF